jgi:predicted membrane GTPase involved in stress response
MATPSRESCERKSPTSVGAVMELVGNRRAECVKMESHGETKHMEFTIPAGGLIGMGIRLMTATSGEAGGRGPSSLGYG